jgi:hypothetical protein
MEIVFCWNQLVQYFDAIAKKYELRRVISSSKYPHSKVSRFFDFIVKIHG